MMQGRVDKVRTTLRGSRAALSVILGFCLGCGSAAYAFAQDAKPAPTWSAEEGITISNEVQKRVGRLTNYGVFDWITFGDHGKTIVIKGYASRPTLKTDLERSLKGLANVEAIENQIEVLPLSPNDDRIRAAVYNRIYTQPGLRKYNANAGSLRRALGPGRPSVALMAGGITNSPPIGYHAIHIIVQGGNVKLFGVVLTEMDVSIAGIQANLSPGVFSVDNNLVVERARSRSAAK